MHGNCPRVEVNLETGDVHMLENLGTNSDCIVMINSAHAGEPRSRFEQ
jgi:hypothetical protein